MGQNRAVRHVVTPCISLPLGFLLLQIGLPLAWPEAAGGVAYLAMVVAPLLTGLATAWRGWREPQAAARTGWWLVTASLLVWTVGGFGNLWHEWVLGLANEMYRGAMLAFHLAAVPLTFLLASSWQPAGQHWVRGIDALLALALGFGYFLITWHVLTVHGAQDQPGVHTMMWLFDAQNLFIVLGALVRWSAAEEADERTLFGVLLVHALLYMGVAGWNNHFIAGDPAYGPEYGAVVTVAFALLASLALRPPQAELVLPRPPAVLVRSVHAAGPLVVPGALLVVSLFLIRVDYAWGTAGVVSAVLGYALRSVVLQVSQIARGEALQREHTALRSLAWTDALTGVGNRRFLDHALAGAWWREQRGTPSVAVLMMDIDHFKLLNDELGHERGDECLRQVAQALQRALVRPGDILARYGGEEFIALLQEVDADGSSVVAERLRAAVQALQLPHPASPQQVVTISIGLACAPLHAASDSARLIRAADQALFQAKRAGRNRVQHHAMKGGPAA